MRRLFRIRKPAALPMREFGAEPGDYTWEDWHSEAKKKYPVKYFLSETFPSWFHVAFVARWKRFWYWVRCHTFTRYHLLDLRSKEYGYKWGYIDPLNQVLVASFRILQIFVEKEDPEIGLRGIDHYLSGTERDEEVAFIKEQLKWEKEIRDLYNWWMTERAKEEEDLYNRRKEGEFLSIQRNLEEKDDEMLHRLLAVRRRLWT